MHKVILTGESRFLYTLDKLNQSEVNKLGDLLLTKEYMTVAREQGTDIKSELAFLYRITEVILLLNKKRFQKEVSK